VSENGFAARGDGRFAMSGHLTFQTVPQYQAKAGALFEGGAQALTIDMQGVSQADSAGLALMIEWLLQARAAKRRLVFSNIPEQVSDLIRVNGLTPLFELK
jgi:phospholipid transport system transporter-binding protein